jgi:hypothetical protein
VRCRGSEIRAGMDNSEVWEGVETVGWAKSKVEIGGGLELRAFNKIFLLESSIYIFASNF